MKGGFYLPFFLYFFKMNRQSSIDEFLNYLEERIEKEDYKQVIEILEKNSVHYDELGVILDKDIVFDDKTKVLIDDLILLNKNWLKKYMEA